MERPAFGLWERVLVGGGALLLVALGAFFTKQPEYAAPVAILAASVMVVALLAILAERYYSSAKANFVGFVQRLKRNLKREKPDQRDFEAELTQLWSVTKYGNPVFKGGLAPLSALDLKFLNTDMQELRPVVDEM